MVDVSKDMDERLVTIKRYIRKAQLQTNLVENPEIGRHGEIAVDVTGISEDIREFLSLALVAAKDVPPIDRMIDEIIRVWKGQMPFRKIADLEHFSGWLVGCTFSTISVIDLYLEASQ